MAVIAEPTKEWGRAPQQSSAKLPGFLSRDRPSPLLMPLGDQERSTRNQENPQKEVFFFKQTNKQIKKIRTQGQGPIRVIKGWESSWLFLVVEICCNAMTHGL